MRKRFYHCCVCSCSPEKGVMFLDVKILKDIVNRGIHAIRCASTCAHKAHRGILLGDLCAETHHPLWALKVWKFTLKQIHAKDYDDWIDVSFNTKYVRLQDVISEGNCEIIGRRIDDIERRIGLSDAQGLNSWAYRAGEGWYNSFRSEKYEYYFNYEEMREAWIQERNDAITAQIFYEGMPELASEPQDFFRYWSNENPQTQKDILSKIDDWE